MNQTDLLAALLALAPLVYTNSVRTTNWVNTGDSQRRSGTNYVEQYLAEIASTDWREEVTPTVIYVTNRVAIRTSRELFSKTNTVLRLTPSGIPPLPPTPGAPTKL